MIAIISMSATDMLMGLRTPKLQVPERFEPTLPDRGWLINPFGGNPIWTLFVAPLPALLATILIFMDQQITAVIINRKEHKLKVWLPMTIYTSYWRKSLIFTNYSLSIAERMWLPLGFICASHFDFPLLNHGHSMVCCRNCTLNESCQLVKNGIRVGSSWRETPVFGCPWTANDAHWNFPYDWAISNNDTTTEKYSDARSLRCLPLHGFRFLEGNAVLWQNFNYIYAFEISAGLHVFATGNYNWQLYLHTIGWFLISFNIFILDSNSRCHSGEFISLH